MQSWRGLGRRGRAAMGRLTAAGHTPADPTQPGGPAPQAQTREAASNGDTGISSASTGSKEGMSEQAAAASSDMNGPGDRSGPGEADGAVVASGNGSVVTAGDRTGTVVVAAERTAGLRNVPEQSRVPSWLQTAAAWSWRLLLIAIVIYLIARLLGILYIVVVPCVAALLLTALLQPLSARLCRSGLPRLAATWVTLLIAAVVLGGLIALVANRATADYPMLVSEAKHTATQVESLLAGPPFHLKSSNVQKFLNDIPSYLSKHKSLVEGTVVTGGKIASELFGGIVLMLFVMFFLIKDGERIWTWLTGAMRAETAKRVDRAGRAAWVVLVYYMRGTVAVAAIHAVVIGLALWIMGVPLAFPLAVLVFLAAFVPLVGLLVAGALAILVTLATKGWIAAVILLGILVIEDQLEAHLLQPQVVGRVIRLHPLAVILSLAVGAVLAGIFGAVVAVPIVAVITRALPELRRREPGDLGSDDP
jgi:predicted PurR-regulated permease PerM